jgi:hypothetical protein
MFNHRTSLHVCARACVCVCVCCSCAAHAIIDLFVLQTCSPCQPPARPAVDAGVLAGHLSDKSGASAIVATSFTLLSVPFLYLYRTIGHTSMAANVALMMLTGFFVNGPYALITTAVSADLGTHDSLQVRACPAIVGRTLCVYTAFIRV